MPIETLLALLMDVVMDCAVPPNTMPFDLAVKVLVLPETVMEMDVAAPANDS